MWYCSAPWRGPQRELLSPRNPKDEVFESMQNALWEGLPLIGAFLGNLKGVRLPGLLREMNSISKYLLDS